MRVPRLLTVLALLGFSLACSGLGVDESEPMPEPPEQQSVDEGGLETDQAALERYVSSPYDYCDAVLLAGMWGETEVGEAKAAIGRLLSDHGDALVESKLSMARQSALENLDDRQLRCSYSDIGFSYEDAVVLGDYWGIDSWDAKLRIEEKFLRDDHSDTHIRGILVEALGTGSAGQMDPIDAYASSPYGYCDALVLGGFWESPTYDAKLKIGRRILEGRAEGVRQSLRTAQARALSEFDNHNLRCSHADIGISYEDAVVLGDYWGIDSWDAKLRVEEKFLRDGHSDTHIMEVLRQAQAG